MAPCAHRQRVLPRKVDGGPAQSFGKDHWLDHVLVIVFNAFYVLNLGLAYNEEYEGPVYEKRTSAAFA